MDSLQKHTQTHAQYSLTQYTVEFLIIRTPPFFRKRCYLLYSYTLLFYFHASTIRWRFWHPEKQVNTFFVLSANHRARDALKVEVHRGSDLVLQATPFAVSRARLVPIRAPSLRKSSIAKPRKTSSKCCRVCHWGRVRRGSCATCGASETFGSLTVQIHIHT